MSRLLGRLLFVLALALLAGGGWQLASAAWTAGKAEVAQLLLERAWSESLESGRPVRPWPWADSHPEARLLFPERGRSLLVLDRADPRSLAFGPARVAGSARPGQGVTVLAGHRDSHFALLRELAPGERLRLQSADGRWRDYRVADMAVLDQPRLMLAGSGDALVLVTCWPFDGLRPGDPRRYAVLAEPAGLRPAELAPGFRRAALTD